MKTRNFFSTLLILFLFSHLIYGQYLQTSLQERTLQSDLIVEAVLSDQFTFDSNGDIFTAYKLEICAILYDKNSNRSTSDELFVLTFGGIHNDVIQDYTHSADLIVGNSGLFFLNSTLSDIPNSPSSDSLFYHLNSGNQGFVSIAHNKFFDLDVYDELASYSHIDAVIDSVFFYLNNSANYSSCILEKKNGLVIYMDSITYKLDTISTILKIKGMYSKGYDIEKTQILINLGTSIDASAFDFYVKPKPVVLKSNYTTSWSQPSAEKLLINVERNSSANSFTATNIIEEYIEIGFNQNALNFNLNQLQISNAAFMDPDQSIIDFQEIHMNINDGLLNMKPDIDYFEPEIVAAGLTQDNSEGSNYKGYLEIHSKDFGNIPTSQLQNEIPWNYSVRFVRDNKDNQNNVNESLKITPHASEYEFWTDTLIRVRVPTYGYLVNGDDIIPTNTPMIYKTAFTGGIHVQRGLLFDDQTKPGKEGTLKVAFAMRNQPNSAQNENSDIHFYPNKQNVGSGGYQFVLDSSFTNNINAGGDPSDFVDQLKDVFCEWNKHSDLKVELVDSCQSNDPKFPCGLIKCVPHDNSSNNLVYATTEIEELNQQCYPNIGVRKTSMNFRYGMKNGKVPFYWSTTPTSHKDSTHFYNTALHEMGHVLQQGHVRTDTSIMCHYKNPDRVLDEPAKAGAYHFKTLSFNAKCPISSGKISSCGPTSILNIETTSVNIYPNITNGNCHVKSDKNIVKILVFNQVGQCIKKIEQVNSRSYNINFSDYQNGIYFISLVFKNSMQSSKIIKL